MDRPLWRIFVNVALLAFVIQRGAGIAMALLAHANPLLVAVFGLQCAVGTWAAISFWTGHRMELSVKTLAATVVLGAAIQVVVAGAVAVPGAIAQAMFAVLAASGMLFLMRQIPEE